MKAATEGLVLAADVGGTNLNLALLSPEGPRFRMLRQARFDTQAQASLLEPLRAFLAVDPALPPAVACIAGAGPVQEGRILLTHVPWDIDGASLERDLGLPVHLVNDFTALACGVRQLDLADPGQVTTLLHGDGSRPTANPRGLALVVGAGTGLGVGFLVPSPQGPRAFPSEGGHLGLPVFDEDSLALWRHLAGGLPGPPGAELAVSGPGLARLLRFLLDSGRAQGSPTTAAIKALPEEQWPAAIAAQADLDPACGRAMAFFLDLYARVCADLCAAFLPTGGLFLAGGIAAKNREAFLREGRFMARFERNYQAHLDRLARATPVFLVHNYDLSLYGAAHALACTD